MAYKKSLQRTGWIFVSAGFLVGPATHALADQVAGDHEIQISGGAFYAQGNDTGTAQGELSYGYYWTPAWQAGISQSLSYSINNDTEDVWTGSTLPFVNYHFRKATNDRRFQPFIGAVLGVGYSDVDVTGTVVAAEGEIFLTAPFG